MNKRFNLIELIILVVVFSLLSTSALNFYENSQREKQETLVNQNLKEAIALMDINPELSKQKIHEADKTITFINGRCLINA